MRRISLALCVAALPLTLSACGAESPTGSPTSTTAAGTSASNTYLAGITKDVDAMYAGNFSLPKESSPVAKGKSIYIVSCGQQVPSCSFPASAAAEAAKRIGWKATLVDGKFSPPEWSKAIETAIAAKVDGIMVISLDCQFIRPQLLKAKKAGIKIGAMFAIDCDDKSVGKEPLYDAPMIANGDPNWATQVSKYEADRMKVVIAHDKGAANVIDFNQDSLPITKYIREAGEAELKKCSGCELVNTVPIALADTPAIIQQKTQSALLQNSKATALFPLYDGMTLSGVATGLQASGKSKDVFLMGADAFPPSIDLIRKGVQDAQLGFPADWAAYAVIDGLNRVFGGREPQDSGIGWQLIDGSKNLPSSGGWQPPVDYKGTYRKLWGVS